MFSKILIANRGAIACRIIRTLNRMQIASVAVYAEADRDSLHVSLADEAFSLGSGAAATTYLNAEKIVAIALQCGARAIHPGYGFLSENAHFVALCEKNNLVFIGPSVANMQAFALKHSARALAEQFQVPLVPGSGVLANVDDALTAAEAIGYPVILKSSAGGGGIGMQVCDRAETLRNAFASVVRLSENNFADGRVFLEKYIERARHLEVQVFGNGLGEAVDIGERDCSLQRRNQKVIEEAPAPYLSEALRDELRNTACRLLAGVNYANAGTVEFIFDTRDERFYFLEVNTRLQVEHGVSEEVFGVDLVQWMIEQAHAPLVDLAARRAQLRPRGHAIQARIYAENPSKNFQPCAGLLSCVQWAANPDQTTRQRIDTWVRSGSEVPVYFDPMLAKVIVWATDRDTARQTLAKQLDASTVYGIETNRDYAAQILRDAAFIQGQMHTRYLSTWHYHSQSVEVLRAGTLTSVQDLPGRLGVWEVGVPPSGPFDARSFQLGNQLLGNSTDAAGLEITVAGPELLFHCDARIAVTGASLPVQIDGERQAMWQSLVIRAGQRLDLGKIEGAGARAYLLIQGGIQCPPYLGSRATFTLGQFGGHNGRALCVGDTLPIQRADDVNNEASTKTFIAEHQRPPIAHHWTLNVIYGPHGAPDFFTEEDIATFFAAEWEVHYNSSRTGIRLVGPKPQWARDSGGEAGMHPSNIHDNAYAFGTVDFTGDMPVILGPDGPSLGGFVCPATVIHADLWKLGQLRAGDKIRFHPVSLDDALSSDGSNALPYCPPDDCIFQHLHCGNTPVTVRLAGDRFMLIEFGPLQLDLRLRFRVHALQEALRQRLGASAIDLTPGIRSLQVHFDPTRCSHTQLLDHLRAALDNLQNIDDLTIPSRVVHLPLSWDDVACRQAIEKYTQSVRPNAPWCPSNIEFIRRINGLASIDAVKSIVFNASYVVMGLGDVYLGAPVATPMDPRHRLVTTKYNPARTWTAENSVGIGGAYLCIYGMEGPGGYQFVGRTLQMWNRYYQTREFSQPWLLRFFDQLRFYPVSETELTEIRREFPLGRYPLRIEETQFSLRDYEYFLRDNADDIARFEQQRQQAFDTELQHWRDSGQFHFDSAQEFTETESDIPQGSVSVDSPVAGSVWKLCVAENERVSAGQVLAILESMKMEIEIAAPSDGVVNKVLKREGQVLTAGQALMYLTP